MADGLDDREACDGDPLAPPGFALYWSWKSRKRGGRPRKDAEIRTLIRQMARDNVGWGAPRVHGDLLKLGVVVSEATVSRTMPRRCGPPSQTWGTFLANHMPRAAAIDFFVVPTATFRSLYVFVVLAHARRRLVHFNVTDAPCAHWTGQQVINAFPYATAPRYLHRDRDAIFGTGTIVVDDARVSVDSVCPPVVGTSRQSRTGTRVRAAWRSCHVLTGPAGLKATIEGADCDTMTGVFKGRVTLCFDGRCDVQRFRQPFTARRAA